MKLKYFALSMACLMALCLTGCSAGRDTNTGESERPSYMTPSPSPDPSDYMSEGVNGGDKDNSNGDRSSTGSTMDDIGRAAGDMARGAGDVVRDAGDAVGNAARDIGDMMR